MAACWPGWHFARRADAIAPPAVDKRAIAERDTPIPAPADAMPLRDARGRDETLESSFRRSAYARLRRRYAAARAIIAAGAGGAAYQPATLAKVSRHVHDYTTI